ncbi:MAG: hypothetical protein L0Z63_10705 [Actinobacteria bacterium]|nr:hypothetical protein [Actinomycetota bacterium]
MATIPNRSAPRLSTMEMFGFIDTPTVVASEHRTTPPMSLVADPFDDWTPGDLALAGRRFRWSRLFVVLVAGVALGVSTFWAWQRPMALAEEARRLVVPAVETLVADLVALPDLTAATIDPTTVNTMMLSIDDDLRAVLETTPVVADPEVRTLLSTLVADAARAQRRFVDVYTYRTSALVTLTAPGLETDPAMVDLEEAAAVFADWQTGLVEMRRSLPGDVLPEVDDVIDELIVSVKGAAGRYLDAIADDDPVAATRVIDVLEDDLDRTGRMLTAGLSGAQEEIETAVREAATTLDLIRSLLG